MSRQRSLVAGGSSSRSKFTGNEAMSRAGREPAEDVKRRLIAACQEVGLVISSAHMHLMREHALRLIYVGASIPNWPQETPMLTVMARVGTTGQWPETVDIRCTSSTASAFSFHDCWMKGRQEAPFQDLIDELTQTSKNANTCWPYCEKECPVPMCSSTRCGIGLIHSRGWTLSSAAITARCIEDCWWPT